MTCVAVIKPLKETILMHELDAPAARARIPERILGLARVPAYPAHVLFLLLIVVVPCSSRRRRRARLDLLPLGATRRRGGRGGARGRGGRGRRRRRRVGDGLGGDRASVEGRRWLVSDLHGRFEPNRPGPAATQGESGTESVGAENGSWGKREREREWERKKWAAMMGEGGEGKWLISGIALVGWFILRGCWRCWWRIWTMWVLDDVEACDLYLAVCGCACSFCFLQLQPNLVNFSSALLQF